MSDKSLTKKIQKHIDGMSDEDWVKVEKSVKEDPINDVIGHFDKMTLEDVLKLEARVKEDDKIPFEMTLTCPIWVGRVDVSKLSYEERIEFLKRNGHIK